MTKAILRIDASMRRDGSRSRLLADRLMERLTAQLTAQGANGQPRIIHRDLADGMPFVHDPWINANFTQDSARTPDQRSVLAQSDALVAELQAADVIVLATPIYNFSVPAALKAWIDLVARARLTFRYTDSGPEGLLTGKTVYLIVTSGGTKTDSAIDFATPYLRHVLGFVGLKDVHVVGSDLSGADPDTVNAAALARIDDLPLNGIGHVHNGMSH